LINKKEKTFINITIIFTTLSGLGIYLVSTFGQVHGILGPENHPSLDYFKITHYLSTPFLIISLGIIFSKHISYNWSKKKRRRYSGIIMSSLFIIIILSGQSLLFMTNQNVMENMKVLHLILGLVFAGFYLFHQSNKKP